jgi:pimeloyl-ACP methyl ester carboxylesterase
VDDLDLIAIDLPGHGLSDPIPSVTCHYLDYVACLFELAQSQGWERFQLIGHSLGGALSSLIAGMRPEKVSRLVLIDTIGPASAQPEHSRETAARYLTAYLTDVPAPIYRSPIQAIKARVQLADMLFDTAERLVERDLHQVPGGYSWRSDVRMRYPVPIAYTEEQILAYLRNISAPVLLVQAERTELVESHHPNRWQSVPNLQRVILAGGHHLHMENPDEVSKVIHDFLVS